MIEIKRYSSDYAEQWDQLIGKSRVDTFLFYRDFMDYHSDRFQDHSFLIFRKGKLEAVLPGNIDGETFYSHQGLTYGGFVSTNKMSIKDITQAFDLINQKLRESHIKNVIYKVLPQIYHKIPSQEDIYILYTLRAEKIGCNLSSSILQTNKIPFIESRKSGIRKAKNNEVKIEKTDDFQPFWRILEENLTLTYGQKPVHSFSEIQFLKNKFPENIVLFNCVLNNEVVGGCILFVMNKVVHVQYISANIVGKSFGVLDLLFDELINRQYVDYQIFDFGQSTEKAGDYLNEQLIFQKEGFGGRGIVYDIYKYQLND